MVWKEKRERKKNEETEYKFTPFVCWNSNDLVVCEIIGKSIAIGLNRKLFSNERIHSQTNPKTLMENATNEKEKTIAQFKKYTTHNKKKIMKDCLSLNVACNWRKRSTVGNLFINCFSSRLYTESSARIMAIIVWTEYSFWIGLFAIRNLKAHLNPFETNTKEIHTNHLMGAIFAIWAWKWNLARKWNSFYWKSICCRYLAVKFMYSSCGSDWNNNSNWE